MGSRSIPISGDLPIRKTKRRSTTRRRTQCAAGDRAPAYSSVPEKIEALKQLIPAINGDRKSDQLFQDTANYIVLLRTQVSILQKLVGIYGSSSDSDSNSSNLGIPQNQNGDVQ
ncbi:unnamed protein product [Cuscuta epithymum]|uniref:BHLH domain-containing protein n=1 Tax=Cuscuta epithymum TaxID=186058 RepID=A0AAV0DJD4_9ASTE|nr:unnamed protein product [Cuscuta epithymum]